MVCYRKEHELRGASERIVEFDAVVWTFYLGMNPKNEMRDCICIKPEDGRWKST